MKKKKTKIIEKQKTFTEKLIIFSAHVSALFVQIIGSVFSVWLVFASVGKFDSLMVLLQGPILKELPQRYDVMDAFMNSTSWLGMVCMIVVAACFIVHLCKED